MDLSALKNQTVLTANFYHSLQVVAGNTTFNRTSYLTFPYRLYFLGLLPASASGAGGISKQTFNYELVGQVVFPGSLGAGNLWTGLTPTAQIDFDMKKSNFIPLAHIVEPNSRITIYSQVNMHGNESYDVPFYAHFTFFYQILKGA